MCVLACVHVHGGQGSNMSVVPQKLLIINIIVITTTIIIIIVIFVTFVLKQSISRTWIHWLGRQAGQQAPEISLSLFPEH